MNLGVCIVLGIYDLQTKQGCRVMKVPPRRVSPAASAE